MSIAQKLFLIPCIGTVGFLIYFGDYQFTVEERRTARRHIEVQYPALDATQSALVKLRR